MQSAERAHAHNKRLHFFAIDFANLFASFVDHFPEPANVTIDEFRKLFDEHQIEYLHYSGTNDLSILYHSIIIEELLQLAAAYLYFPVGIARAHVRPFAILLTYFLFATQPGLSIELEEKNMYGTVTQIRIARGIMEELIEAVQSTLAFYGIHETQQEHWEFPLHLEHERKDVLSRVECVAILSLNKYDAWSIQPFEDVSLYMAAIIEAHDTLKIPLLKVSASNSSAPNTSLLARYGHTPARSLNASGVTEHGTLLQSSEFRNELSLYEQMKHDAGM